MCGVDVCVWCGCMWCVNVCIIICMYGIDMCMWRVNVFTHTCIYGRFCMFVVWMYVCGMDVCVDVNVCTDICICVMDVCGV